MTGAGQAEGIDVSLIIVSRGRPDHLRLVMSALHHQTTARFELIVVSDQPNLDGFPGADRATHVPYDQPNISAARNLGLAEAQAKIVAFCDDDAVPDPTWLERILAPFSDAEVGISAGFTRGRNGIEFQWKAVECDENGDDRPVDLKTQETKIRRPAEGYYPRAQGTNCAFRKSALLQAGGFDEGFRFFLDETDVCLRLGQAGWATAFVPGAQVHHGFASSEHRSDARVPKSLFEIGASKALFLAKHSRERDVHSINRLLADRRRQAISLMVDGRIEPRDVPRLMATLEEGLKSPNQSKLMPAADSKPPAAPKPFLAITHKGITAVAGLHYFRSRLFSAAQKVSAQGKTPIIYRYSLTGLFHRRFFHPSGFWVQVGGLFGRSHRREPIFRLSTVKRRTHQEVASTRDTFKVSQIVFIKFRSDSVTNLTE